VIKSVSKKWMGRVQAVLFIALVSSNLSAYSQNSAAITCADVPILIRQNVVYLEYLKARELRKDQAIAKFDWYQKPTPAYQPNPFDPLEKMPPGVFENTFEISTLRDCVFPAGEQLDEAKFRGADLTRSTFNGESLRDAWFDVYKGPLGNQWHPTILRNVKFIHGDLTGATFAGADMEGVIFQPDKLPLASDISEAKNLQLMTYDQDPSAMSSLRQLFRDGGFALQDSEINYAINQRRLQLAREQCVLRRIDGRTEFRECLAYAGSKMIDATCQFGLNLWRPVQIGFAAWIVFSFVFFLFMHHSGPSGLYLVIAKGVVLEPDAIKDASKVRSTPFGAAFKNGQGGRWLFDEARLARIAMFFSLINGFNIGFRDADIGRWLRLLPRREFEFRAVGWSRTFAGIQALLTLYLLTIWLLCALSHPFG